MAASRWFGQLQAAKEHLTRSGVGSEIRDLRRDIESAFQALSPELDGVTGRPCTLTSIYLDPVNGSDSNDGLTLPTAWKTWAKFLSVVGMNAYVNSPLTINLAAGTFPITDPFVWRPVFGPNGGYQIIGTLTLVSAGTFTAVTPRNPAVSSDTLTCLSITDTSHAASWAADVGRLMKITAGTAGNIGAGMFISKDLGSNACRLSSALKQTITGIVTSSEVVPVIGDSYEVYTMTEVAYMDVYAQRSGQSISVASSLCLIQNVRLNSGSIAGSKLLGDRNVCFELVNCRNSSGFTGSAMRAHNCCFDGTASPVLVPQGRSSATPYDLQLFGGVCIGRSFTLGGVSAGLGFYVQGSAVGSFISGPGIQGKIIDAGVMDWSGILPAVWIQQGSVINGGQPGSETMKLWGYSATANTFGVKVSGGKLHCTSPTNLIIKGALTATKDFEVNGQSTLAPFDRAASPPQYKAAINCTWALFNTTVAGGGFGGYAIDPASGNGIVTEV